MIQAAEKADWNQVIYNGGPPCFHLDDCGFCFRAQRWQGHDDYHAYVSLAAFVRAQQLKGWQDCLDSVRASLRGYPNAGGDIEIMREVERIARLKGE